MATDLERFRDHCRNMATAVHRPEPECLFRPDPWRKPIPRKGCTGCVTPEDRVLWKVLADEVDRYLAAEADEHEALFAH